MVLFASVMYDGSCVLGQRAVADGFAQRDPQDFYTTVGGAGVLRHGHDGYDRIALYSDKTWERELRHS
jgi:hypothetical protein